MVARTSERYFDEAAFQRACLREAAEASTTFFDVAFAPMPGSGGVGVGVDPASTSTSSSTPPPLLLAADSSGRVRAYLSAAVAATWLTAREAEPSSDPVFAWRAHTTSCYRLALMRHAGLLLTAGDDGCVRGWRLSEVGEAALAAAQRRDEQQEAAEEEHDDSQGQVRRQQPGAGGDDEDEDNERGPSPLRPAFEARLPPHEQHHRPGPSSSSPAAAQALAADDHGGREPAAFCGASDGGLFCLVGLGGGRAELSSVGGGMTGGGAVLAADVCPATGALASGGEDGVVRVWSDPRRTGGGRQPVASFVAGQEVATAAARPPPPPAGAAAAAAAAAAGGAAAPHASLGSSSSSYVSALKFDPGTGGWLVAGTGAGEIELFSLQMNALARRAPAAGRQQQQQQMGGALVPQALLLRPGEILGVGTASLLVAHRFSLDPPSELARCEIATDSAFALASSSEGGGGGGGTLAVAGSGATIELLSSQFTRLGLVQPPPQLQAV